MVKIEIICPGEKDCPHRLQREEVKAKKESKELLKSIFTKQDAIRKRIQEKYGGGK